MKEKRYLAEWKVAVFHWIVVVVSAALLGGLIGQYVIAKVLPPDTDMFVIGLEIGYLLVLWFVSKYSAKYLGKSYIIKNSARIILLSTIFIVIQSLGGMILQFGLTGVPPDGYVDTLLFCAIFFLSTKRYMKNNSFGI